MIYDNSILINNINTLMNDNNITQSVLANIINSQQSRVNKCLQGKGAFTLPQLISIAQYFNITLDALVGIEKKDNSEDEKEFLTYSDVFKIMFSLEKLFNVRIINVMESDITEEEYFNLSYDTVVSQGIDFGDPIITKFLEEWRFFFRMKKSVEAWEEPYKTWKEGILKRYNIKIEPPAPTTPNTDNTPRSNINSFMDIPNEGLPFA